MGALATIAATLNRVTINLTFESLSKDLALSLAKNTDSAKENNIQNNFPK